jgi:hypothetical protein
VRLFGLVVVAVVAVSSCGGRPASEQAALSSSWVAPAMLSSVPADSPYVLGVLEPVDDGAVRAARSESWR